MQAEKLKGHLDLLLLSVLSRGPGHGYEIITRLKVHSDGAFELPEGTVYPALYRLEGAGLLTSCLLYTSPSPRDRQKSRMPSSA